MDDFGLEIFGLNEFGFPLEPCESICSSDADINDSTSDKETLARFDTLSETAKEESPVPGIFLDNTFGSDYGRKVDTYCLSPSVEISSPYDLLSLAAEDKHLAMYPSDIVYAPPQALGFDYGLPTPTDERTMSFSSASSCCSSDSDPASPLIAPRQLQTPPPSPSGVDLKQEEQSAEIQPSQRSSMKAKGLRGVPADQFFVMENAFTPARPQTMSTQQQPQTLASHPQYPIPNPNCAYLPSAPRPSHYPHLTPLTIPPTATQYPHTISPALTAPSRNSLSPTLPPTPITIAPVRSSTNRSSSTPHPKPFHCELCPASFSRKHDLKRHTRIHLGIRPFKCDACGKVFSRHDALNRHIIKWGCDKKLEAMAVAAAAAAQAHHAAGMYGGYVVPGELGMPYGIEYGLGVTY